ncbi:substrate-binding domain-containing protein [Sphingomonas abietis]|uniref:Substrate-binding domain-containing protein n=1 Tax=Sphingomonas abietis TaxID=3012344 RepID=A0ABY7NIZ7_9SPHN|nr:substrate-binding domain-containing protein [Sphingomonas abietis]WBO21227.1 substrate-binding domain-containing protein [Sphingomonas abietis]
MLLLAILVFGGSVLGGCAKAPVAPAPRQIRIVGSIAGFPFTTLAAERLMRDDADAIAPLVRAGGAGDGIARFCGGSGEPYPDLVLASRDMNPAEIGRCAHNGVGDVVRIPIGEAASPPAATGSSSATAGPQPHSGVTPLVLMIKADDVTGTPALARLLGGFADALAPAGAFEQRGLIPLPDYGRAAAIARLRSLANR